MCGANRQGCRITFKTSRSRDTLSPTFTSTGATWNCSEQATPVYPNYLVLRQENTPRRSSYSAHDTMASSTTQASLGAQRSLSNKPENKLPPIPDGARIRKRPLPLPPHRRTLKSAASSVNFQNQATPDIDGYLPPPRANHTQIIKVSSSASHISLVKRVRKALENARNNQQGTTKGLPLAARIAALGVKNGRSDPTGPIADALDDVVLIATGRAIQKAIEVGASFTRERDLIVIARTRTVQAVDDIEMVDEDAEEEDSARVRQVSCIEVGVRWAN